jgi:membrane protein required for colicin V production
VTTTRASAAPRRACACPRIEMNGFDIAVLVVVVLSTLLAFARGVVRELIALASWVAALVLALALGGEVASMLPVLETSPAARYILAAGLVFIGVLVAGAAIAHLLTKAVRAVGLGFLDRLLGAVFGIARGVAIVLLFVLVAGVTTLPRYEWWQNAAFGPVLVTAALALRPWLPPGWAGRLDYSPGGRRPERPLLSARAAPTGGSDRCAES